jgi:hypothetical protein
MSLLLLTGTNDNDVVHDVSLLFDRAIKKIVKLACCKLV